MPLAIGNKKIESLYLRNNNIAKAYRGETLVFQAPAGPTPTDAWLIVMAAGANGYGECATNDNVHKIELSKCLPSGSVRKSVIANDIRAGSSHAIIPQHGWCCGRNDVNQLNESSSFPSQNYFYDPQPDLGAFGALKYAGFRSSGGMVYNMSYPGYREWYHEGLTTCGENVNFMLGLYSDMRNPITRLTPVKTRQDGSQLDFVKDCVFGYGFMHLIVGDDRHTEFCGLSATGQSGSGNLSMIQKITPSGLSNVKELKAGYLSSWALLDDAAKTLMFTGLTQYGEGGCGQITGGMPAKTTWFPTLTGVTCFDSARKFTGNAINYSAASVGGQLKVTGSVACGQFGNGKNADQSYLWKDVAGIKNVTSIACGDEFLAVIDGGLLKVAGKNVKGVFGDPNLTVDAVYSTFQTIPIPGGRRPVKVVAGSETLYVLVEAIDDDLTGWRVYP